MKSPGSVAAILVALISLAVSVFVLSQGDRNADKQTGEPARSERVSATTRSSVQESINALSRELAALKSTIGAETVAANSADDETAIGEESQSPSSIDERLKNLESALTKLQSAFDGISIEGASAERDELFRSENGHLKADEYAEAGKHAIAGEGYLTFLQNHPDHPDAHDILRRASNAFQKAGYTDKAIWAQREMLENFPEYREQDLITLSQMEKEAELYDDAIAHVAEAAEMASTDEARLWRRMYWAWYNQLRDGNQAGLEAYQTVQEEIRAAGLGEHRMAERTQQKIDEIQQRLAAQNR